MYYKRIVQKALHQIWSMDTSTDNVFYENSSRQSSLISRLIYDIFGGDILKTHLKKGWHFYNRINGERVDFSVPETNKTSTEISFEDIPCSKAEANNYYIEEDYSNLFVKFIRVFEEVVGLKRQRFTTAS